MTVRHEIKSQLAKLLATEDLVVEHKKVETACFNVHTRVLTLPMWERASSTVYDLLVGHEVGHALYTPDEDWLKTHKIPPQFVNVVEDVRIEKLMKRRYAGLSKTFYRGYEELAEEDFFQIADDDLSTYNLADKVNLYYKIGNFENILFEDDEKEIVSMIGETETFADVLIAAEALYKFCKKEKIDTSEKLDENQEGESSSQNFDGDTSFESDSEDESGEIGDGQPRSQDDDNFIDDEVGGESEKDDDIDLKTVNSLEEALKQLASTSGRENIYLELPELDLNKIIVPNSEIHDKCKEYWSSWMEEGAYFKEEVFGEVDKKFLEFKRSAQKEVNYLVKEFECRKAADSYARATTARTGVLDCSKLHTYKYNEDLFKKVTTLADGKNHGLVFILDWSGSMCDVMLDTVKQLFNLVWFCKKVSIPFEVYAFTSDYPLVSYDDGKANFRELAYKKRDGILHVGEWFSLMNFLTSKVNSKNLEEQMKNIFRLAYSYCRYTYAKYPCPNGLSLSGTPLNETMIALHQILPKFKRDNKLQKVQCVVLTDGEGYDLKRHVSVDRHWEKEPYVGTVSIDDRCILRDRKTGNTYSLNVQWYEQTDVFLRNLKDKFVDVNFIGIRVLESRDAGSFIRRYCGYYGDNFDFTMKEWKKEKSFSLKTSGYDTYFGISSNHLSKDSEFEVHECATKSQIKSAFVKSLKTKKMNKKVLGEFINLVA